MDHRRVGLGGVIVGALDAVEHPLEPMRLDQPAYSPARFSGGHGKRYAGVGTEPLKHRTRAGKEGAGDGIAQPQPPLAIGIAIKRKSLGPGCLVGLGQKDRDDLFQRQAGERDHPLLRRQGVANAFKHRLKRRPKMRAAVDERSVDVKDHQTAIRHQAY